jgi:rod shape-determining protein MreC
VLTLNKGSVNGIKKNMPVLTDDGLLGYVCEIGLDWCRVSTIIETSSSIGVYTDRGGVLGVVEGDTELRKQGLCRMAYIESDSNIQIGDRVYTAGSEKSLYPTGLLVGSVSSIEVDATTGEMIATVTPAVSFNDLGSISGVMIVTEISSSEPKGEE